MSALYAVHRAKGWFGVEDLLECKISDSGYNGRT